MKEVEEPYIFARYFQIMEKTECPLIFHRWALISAIGTIMGRKYIFGKDTAMEVFANQYVVLVGPPATRKNVAIKYSKRILKLAGYNRFASDKTSKEKFCIDVMEGPIQSEGEMEDLDWSMGGVKHEVLISAPELQDFFGQGNMDFISLLTNLWDTPSEYKVSNKNSKGVLLKEPTISLIGGATPTTLVDIFPEKTAGQGFLSRGLFIFAPNKRKEIAFPEKIADEELLEVVDILAAIKENEDCVCRATDEAMAELTKVYNSEKGWKKHKDVRLASYAGRRFSHLMKLAMVCAAAELNFDEDTGDLIITKQHALYANSILCFSEGFMTRALGSMGKSNNIATQNKILEMLEHCTNASGYTAKDISESLVGEVSTAWEVVEGITSLVQMDRVQKLGDSYVLAETGPVKQIFCDYGLIKEGREFYQME